jgi:hypothetical protein
MLAVSAAAARLALAVVGVTLLAWVTRASASALVAAEAVVITVAARRVGLGLPG